MIKLNKNLEYALLALEYLQQAENEQKPSNVKTIASHLNAPFDSLARVMQRLVKSEIIKSDQGYGGGYTIACDLKAVTLNDLIKSLQGPLEIVKCLSHQYQCEMETNCKIKQPVNFLNNKLIEFYKNITLQELLQGSQNTVLTNKEELA